jgi:hypothetical protein
MIKDLNCIVKNKKLLKFDNMYITQELRNLLVQVYPEIFTLI